VTAPLTTTSPVIAGRDRIEDKHGNALAFVRWPDLAPHQGWLRRAAQRARAKSFDLVAPDGTLLCRAAEGSLRPGGKDPSRVWRADGTEIGNITVVRLGARSFQYLLRDAAGALLGEGRFVTKVKYGDVPKKLTHAFDDAEGKRLATADRKPGGGPQRIGFDGRASDDLRLLAICLMIMLPNAEIGGAAAVRQVTREPEDFDPAPQTADGLFQGTRLVFHRDRLTAPDGRVLATVREPSVAPHRGLSRALSAHPQGGRYRFEVAGPAGETLFTIDKSSGAIRYEVEVSLPHGGRLGTIQRTAGAARAVHTITAEPGMTLATVTATAGFSSDHAVTLPGGAQVAAVSRVQAVDEPWQIGVSGDCDERLRILLVSFVIVQELMLDL
jgi:hypothetical protein